MAEKVKAAKKNFIQAAIKHPGALHKDLHVPKGKKIPVSKLKKAVKAGGIEAKRANLALTLKKLSHKKKAK